MPVLNNTVLLVVLLLGLGGCTATQPLKPERDTLATAPQGQLVALADGVAARGEPATALAIYERALAQTPEHRAALLGKGVALTALGRHAEAERTLRQARDLDRDDARVLAAYARLLIASERAEIAIGELAAYLDTHPVGDAALWNLHGLALDAVGRHREAEAAYQAGLARTPESVALRNNLAYSRILRGHYAQAVEVLRGLVDTRGGQARHRQNLALAYGLAGDDRAAREVARLDLQGEAVARNLAYYEWLRELPAPTRYQALLRRP